MMTVLEEQNFPVGRFVPLASSRSAGMEVTFQGKPVKVQVLTGDSLLV